MEQIFEISERRIQSVSESIIRSQMNWLLKGDRMIGITGARGAGKTTLLLQFAKIHLSDKKRLYVSLDDILFADKNLVELADDFVKIGGEYLLLDEVHSYQGWARSIKNIYDRYPELNIIFTGSSMLHLSEGLPELSRRVVLRELHGLSLREFIRFSRGMAFDVLTLDDILANHQDLAREVWKKIKPLEVFQEYLKSGYYPYYFEARESYDIRLRETINKVLESDLVLLTGISQANSEKLKRLLYVISQSVPFTPNIDKLASRLGMGKNTLKTYLKYLDMAGITTSLYSQKKGISALTKPEKIYLRHPNLMYALDAKSVQKGSLRESFFLSQLTPSHLIQYPVKGDFLIDENLLFEIGGRKKSDKQIQDHPNAWIAADDIETGLGNKIPLWLFGFLY